MTPEPDWLAEAIEAALLYGTDHGETRRVAARVREAMRARLRGEVVVHRHGDGQTCQAIQATMEIVRERLGLTEKADA